MPRVIVTNLYVGWHFLMLCYVNDEKVPVGWKGEATVLREEGTQTPRWWLCPEVPPQGSPAAGPAVQPLRRRTVLSFYYSALRGSSVVVCFCFK